MKREKVLLSQKQWAFSAERSQPFIGMFRWDGAV
jgi:hypothetical protein